MFPSSKNKIASNYSMTRFFTALLFLYSSFSSTFAFIKPKKLLVAGRSTTWRCSSRAWDLEAGGHSTEIERLRGSLSTSEDRTSWLKSIVGRPDQTSWNDVKLVMALCMRSKPEWTFGLFDQLVEDLCAGKFDHSSEEDALLSAEIEQILPQCLPDSDLLAMDLMIQSIQEEAEDEAEFEADVRTLEPRASSQTLYKTVFDKSRYLKETYEKNLQLAGTKTRLPEIAVSPEADTHRRAMAFKALCLLRFVRLGI